MRLLLVTWAWPSHLNALVPFAWAARLHGHEVLLVSQPELAAELDRTGLPWAVVGTDVDAAAMVAGYAFPRPQDAPAPTSSPAGKGGRGPRAMEMFIRLASAMTGPLIELARQWQPDAVVFEPTALAGPIAAAALGIPAIRHLYGTDLMYRARAVLPEALAELTSANGVGLVNPLGVATIDPTPQSLQLPTDYRRLGVRHVAYNGMTRQPTRPAPRSGRPRVCVTWGHTMAKLAPDRFLAGDVVRALMSGTGPKPEVVLAVTSAQRSLLGEIPDDVPVFLDRPIDQVFVGCDAVVAHGGAGTVLTAAGHGLPQLLIPQLPDHAGHAARVLVGGVGEVLTVDEASPSHIREHVVRVLDGPAREAARRLAVGMTADRSPAEVVTEVTDLIRTV